MATNLCVYHNDFLNIYYDHFDPDTKTRSKDFSALNDAKVILIATEDDNGQENWVHSCVVSELARKNSCLLVQDLVPGVRLDPEHRKFVQYSPTGNPLTILGSDAHGCKTEKEFSNYTDLATTKANSSLRKNSGGSITKKCNDFMYELRLFGYQGKLVLQNPEDLAEFKNALTESQSEPDATARVAIEWRWLSPSISKDNQTLIDSIVHASNQFERIFVLWNGKHFINDESFYEELKARAIHPVTLSYGWNHQLTFDVHTMVQFPKCERVFNVTLPRTNLHFGQELNDLFTFGGDLIPEVDISKALKLFKPGSTYKMGCCPFIEFVGLDDLTADDFFNSSKNEKALKRALDRFFFDSGLTLANITTDKEWASARVFYRDHDNRLRICATGISLTFDDSIRIDSRYLFSRIAQTQMSFPVKPGKTLVLTDIILPEDDFTVDRLIHTLAYSGCCAQVTFMGDFCITKGNYLEIHCESVVTISI